MVTCVMITLRIFLRVIFWNWVPVVFLLRIAKKKAI